MNGLEYSINPIFYIHGDSDWIIRYWHSEELYKNTTAFKRLNIIIDRGIYKKAGN